MLYMSYIPLWTCFCVCTSQLWGFRLWCSWHECYPSFQNNLFLDSASPSNRDCQPYKGEAKGRSLASQSCAVRLGNGGHRHLAKAAAATAVTAPLSSLLESVSVDKSAALDAKEFQGEPWEACAATAEA